MIDVTRFRAPSSTSNMAAIANNGEVNPLTCTVEFLNLGIPLLNDLSRQSFTSDGQFAAILVSRAELFDDFS